MRSALRLAILSVSAFILHFSPIRAQASNDLIANSNYYDQFLFRMIGDCSDINSISFVKRGSLEDIPIGTDSAGRKVAGYFIINLFEDRTYWARYVEFIKPNGEFKITYQKILQGDWHVTNNRIHIDEIGTGVPSHASTGNAFTIIFARDIRGPITGKRTIMTGMVDGEGPHGETAEEYCAH